MVHSNVWLRKTRPFCSTCNWTCGNVVDVYINTSFTGVILLRFDGDFGIGSYGSRLTWHWLALDAKKTTVLEEWSDTLNVTDIAWRDDETHTNFTQTFLFLTHASWSALSDMRTCADISLYISSSTAVMSSGSSATMVSFHSLSSAFFFLEWRSFLIRYHSPPWSMR